jgi:protease-4
MTPTHRSSVFAFGLAASTLLAACGGEHRFDTDAWGELESDETKLAEIVLEAPPRETARPALFERTPPAMLDVIERIREVGADKNVKGVFLRVSSFGGAWGRTADLIAALSDVRKTKKPIHCHFDSTDNSGFLLAASVCDRISMNPAGWLNLIGVAAQTFYAREFLEKLGLEADFVKMGRYKSAIEPLTQDGMSDASREMLGALLDDYDQQLVSGIARGRSLPEAKVKALLDEGPFDAAGAVELKLIDDVAFDDEAREHLRRATKTKRIRRVPLRKEDQEVTLATIIEALAGNGDEGKPDGDRLAVVYVVGNIVDGEESSGDDAVAGPFVRQMRRLADDPKVKAVVVRIDSPGGSAGASDRMWHAVRAAEKRKPVIISVGDMAASGGYYIAAGGREIYAEPLSLVGSIGVFGGKISLKGLGEKLGIHTEKLSRSKNAGWMSATEKFSDSERVVFQRMLERTYWRFIDRVASGRKLDKKDVLKVAEGRVWTAKRALDVGLVTKLGAFGEAIARARQLGKLSADAPIDAWPREMGVLESLAGRHNDDETLARLAVGPAADRLLEIRRQTGLVRSLLTAEQPVMTALPFTLDIR